METIIIRQFIRLSRLPLLAINILMYALGVAIAYYLGEVVDIGLYVGGQIWLLALQLAIHFLYEYFKIPANPTVKDPPPDFSRILGDGKGLLPRITAMLAAAAMLTSVALLTSGMQYTNNLHGTLIVVMVSIIVIGFVYAVPPIRLVESGYGELLMALTLSTLVPAFGFFLMGADSHRFLLLSTLPFVLVFLAIALVYLLPQYARDIKFKRKNLLTLIGWENGMLYHNFFILSAFVLLGVAMFLGVPAAIGLPVFLPLPLGLLQIWYMQKILRGAKPNWQALKLSAIVLYFAMAYIFIIRYWLR
jgi:1,4-dihydroxy-2-naphthoate octaprenyltransferase